MRAVKNDWSEGNNNLSWKNMKERFEGNVNNSKLELQIEIMTDKLESNKDPDIWITILERIKWDLENKNGVKIMDQELLNQVILFFQMIMEHFFTI